MWGRPGYEASDLNMCVLLGPPHRKITTSSSGAVLPEPIRPYKRHGLFWVAVVTTPFVLTGAMVAKWFAWFLDEYDLFVADDDDDDDD